jgi:hypothetical protein
LYPLLSTVLTLSFFMAMALRADWISQPAIGRYGSVSFVVAVVILVAVALGVWSYGRLATVIELRTRIPGTGG